MTLNKQQLVVVGVLLTVGVIALLNLWWLLWPAALVGAGAVGYMHRRAFGRVNEAVQVGLWTVGLALVFLFGINLLAGLLVLAGASMLVRGREQQADEWIQQTVARLTRRSPAGSYSIQRVPVSQAPVTHVPITEEPSTNETTRL